MSRDRPDPGEDVVPTSVRQRREAATRARQRQLLMIDMAAALVLALLFLVLAPGLAIVALGSLVVLAGCCASLLYGRLRMRARRGGGRRSGPSGA